jgi:hypothetical protein
MSRRRAVSKLSVSLAALMQAAPLVGVVVCVACSDSSSSPTVPCNEDPWECPAGRTCWPTSSTEFDCLISGPGKPGDPCQNTTNLPSCGDGMACLSPGASGDVCAPYCDASHACPAGMTCMTGSLVGTTAATAAFRACVGTPVSIPDGGAD